ncbi:hypothetical protein ACGK9U_06485 [Mariniflexile sp. HNIBRBA6329]|uniref:hypothetical protein n=1 Tax=Mariniflexile sp. HNIBRBA6329 TaxID=3373088 RepID=UPI0037450658
MKTIMNNPNKRLLIILTIPLLLLSVPLIAMQFSDEVNWSLFDFVVAGILLLGTTLIIELILRKVKTKRNRIILAIIVISLLLITWAELAVGVFGTPFAGS